jgi:hypothetical protein
MPYNASAFGGVEQPCAAGLNTPNFATLPRAKRYEHYHVRCNTWLGCGPFLDPVGGMLARRSHCEWRGSLPE